MNCSPPKHIFKLINELFEIEKTTCAVEQTFQVNGTSNGESGEITSPDYPANYPDNINYTWILRTGHLKANVTFTILNFDIIKHNFTPCEDYLQVRKTIYPCLITRPNVAPPQSNKYNVHASRIAMNS